jgi:hypothetical protein
MELGCGLQTTAKSDEEVILVKGPIFLPSAALEGVDLFFMFYFILQCCSL